MTTVYVASAAGTNGVYHTNQDCPRLRGRVREWAEEDTEKLNYSLCETCSDESHPRHRQRKALRNRI